MLTITNVLMPDETRQTITRPYHDDITIDGSDLLALPGLIDPHVHFRVPGLEEKEDWQHASIAAIKGGYTMVFDMPNTKPATTTQERLHSKFNIINDQLQEVNMPLRYKLFFGADKNQFHEIEKVKDEVVGLKVFMGASTGDLLMDDESSLHALYALAKAHNLVVALHAEDELIIRNNAAKYVDETDFKYHSIIREPQAAVKAVELVIKLTEMYDVTSYILHVSTAGELELVKKAKERGLPIYVETCPHYLFLDDSMYPTLHGRGKMNPPLRDKADQAVLWDALNSGMIDTIGSDHAPHKLGEKEQPLCKCPSGVPGIETTLPLLINAWQSGLIKLSRIVELLNINPKKIFNLAENDDLVLVDITNKQVLKDENMATKCKWTPFVGMELTGFPRYVYVDERLIDCREI